MLIGLNFEAIPKCLEANIDYNSLRRQKNFFLVTQNINGHVKQQTN